MNKKLIAAGVIVLVVLTVILLLKNQEKPVGILDTIEGYRGHTQVVSQEEFDFYTYFVERDLAGDISAEELESQVKAYAERVHATFYLGNQLGLCEPYSFETLKVEMEQENASRQEKIAAGEVVYGLKEFTLQNYFQYTMDNLQVSLRGYLAEHADERIMEMSKTYFEEHKEEFRYIEEMIYEQTLDGETETVTADADMLSFYGKSDPGLADFLAAAEIGDVYEDTWGSQTRRVVLKEITYGDDSYENNADMALYRFIWYELYDTVIQTVAENNPVEFENN